MTKNLGQLTSPAISEEIGIGQYQTHLISLSVTNLTGFLEVQIEYSFDKMVWENLDEDSTFIDEEGINNFIITPDFPVDFLRVNLISGTANVQIIYKGVN